MEKNQVKQTGINGITLIGIAFIVLKLVGVIDWNWWWVLCPFWAGIALFLISLFVGIILHIIIKNTVKPYKGRELPKSRMQRRLDEIKKKA